MKRLQILIEEELDAALDTSFWIALRNRRNPHHAEVRALFEKRADAGLVTSNQVRGETWTYLRRRAGHSSAVDFLDALDRSPRLQVVFVELRIAGRS